MTPEPSEGPRHAQPGQRALGAMGSAVQRARANQGIPGPPGPAVGSDAPTRPPVAMPPDRPRHLNVDDGRAGRESPRWLAGAVVVVALLVVASGIALAVSTTGGSGGPSPSAASTTQPGRTGGSSATATTTVAPSTPGAPPHISSLAPASGHPGQTVTATGSNFLSSDGSIVASFDGQVTATSCSSQNVCTVTVPPASAGETSAHVTITTSSGTSNTITFSYS